MSNNLIALQNRFLGEGETVYDRLAQMVHDEGAVTPEGIERLAEASALPKAFIRSVATFYDDLRLGEAAPRRLDVCNGEACAASGASRCAKRLREAGGDDVQVGHVTCLGYCGDAPAARLRSDGEETVFSLADQDIEAVAARISADSSAGLDEPVNRIYAAEGAANILLRHMAAGDVSGLEAARAAGIYGALAEALKGDPSAIIDELDASGLRGRGGAGFPAGIKLRTVAGAPAKDGLRYVVINADEGDAGAYIDKELLERDPHSVIEGALLAAYAVGASEGFIYLRAEYPTAQRIFANAISEAEAAGILGASVLGSDFAFKLKLVPGHGAYVCGEETSLLRSLEGVPAQVSPKPPYPAIQGYRGAPTVVNNVETLANLPYIVAHGGATYAALGTGRSRGTKLVSLNSAVKRPGLYEFEMGVTLRHILFEAAGGMADGLEFKAVQVGGPLGGILGPDKLDLPLDFEAYAAADALLGHAGMVVFHRGVDLISVGRDLMRFCAVESCGKCFPCRIGSARGTELFEKILAGRGAQADLDLLAELGETMRLGSLCALGGAIPLPMDNLLTDFISEFSRYIEGAETPAALTEDPA